MRLPPDAHLAQPWRVHDVAHDFELLDVWRFPLRLPAQVPFERFLEFLDSSQHDLVQGGGPAAWLFRLREALGRLFGWDDTSASLAIPGCEESSLRDRLDAPGLGLEGPHPDADRVLGAFTPVYRFEDEVLIEISNATVHAAMHLGRVALADGCWAPQMAVYVRPRGRLGRFYMALISPFRHWVVYPAMMRSAERGWPRYARREGLDPGQNCSTAWE